MYPFPALKVTNKYVEQLYDPSALEVTNKHNEGLYDSKKVVSLYKKGEAWTSWENIQHESTKWEKFKKYCITSWYDSWKEILFIFACLFIIGATLLTLHLINQCSKGGFYKYITCRL